MRNKRNDVLEENWIKQLEKYSFNGENTILTQIQYIKVECKN